MKARWGIWCSDPEDRPHWFGAWLNSDKSVWAEPVFYRDRADAMKYRNEMAKSNPYLTLTVKRVQLTVVIAPPKGAVK